ncbi:MAG TPA: ABC transporter permease [Terriglobia bacterium]|nr:ABC transporter permease [Terriglobia bacterium]
MISVALIAIALAASTDAFIRSENILNVLRQASLTFLIASGLTLVVLTAGLDLSVGAVVGLSACLTGAAVKATGSIPLGIAVGLACGVVIGIANGLMVTSLKLPPFIATYGMLWIVYGINYWYMAGDTIYGFSDEFKSIGNGYALGVPIPVYLMIAFLILGTLFTRNTTYGHEIYAIGANAEAARLSGIPVRARLVLVYTLSGAMAGLAGVVYLARLGSAEAGIGDPLLLPVIAAVLIGGTSLFGGSGSLCGTLIGALILTLVLNGMNLLTVNAHWHPLVYGGVVLIAAGLDAAARKWSDG